MASVSGLPSYLYPVRHTFIDDPAGRLDSLEGFLHERQAFSCPVSRVEEPGSGVEVPAKAASESPHDKSTAAPQASETRSQEAEESDCSTVDTGSLHDVPHTPELEPATAFQLPMSLTGLLSHASASHQSSAASSEQVLSHEHVPTSSFFSSMTGFAAPFSPGAGAYFGNDVMTTGGVTSHGLHHELQGNHHTHTTHGPTHGTTHLSHGHHVANQNAMPPAMPNHPMPMGTHQHHGLAHQMGGPQSPPPPEPAPNVPPAQLPQVPSHVPTQNGSGPQVLKLEAALAPATAPASLTTPLEEAQRAQMLEVQQAAAVAAAQAVSATHEEQVAAANAFASASGLVLQQESTPAASGRELPSAGSTGHGMGQCRPCAFWTTKGCSSGQDCQFCHLCAPGEKKRRQKAKRAFFGALAEMQRCFTGDGSEGLAPPPE